MGLAEDEYEFFGGCENGDLSCEDSMVCGWEVCAGCPLEKCKEKAQDGDSYAFAYGGRDGTVCRLCNKTAFDNREIFSVNNARRPWGIYQKYTQGKSVSSCNIHPTAYFKKNVTLSINTKWVNVTGCPEICNNHYSPVCGTDETTYSNVCHLTQTACIMGSTDLIIDYEGECRGKILQTYNHLSMKIFIQ